MHIITTGIILLGLIILAVNPEAQALLSATVDFVSVLLSAIGDMIETLSNTEGRA